ncbi:MAG: 50S ribosomal protein L7/L12 [Candidatus Aminicenantes bacterium]|nr:50S ribosomal protein L7/L12 [Candidatus Aminicenantes bacterium]
MPKAQTKEASETAKEKQEKTKLTEGSETPKEKEKTQVTEASETPKVKQEKTKLTKEQFFGHLDNLTVLELADYIKEFEERYGVSAIAAAAPMAAPGAGAPQGEAKAEEEKAEFTVILKSVGDKKINVIKTVREVTSLGLKEAKDLVDNAPKPVKEGVSKEEAEEIKAKFEAEGAGIELQ